MMMSYKKIAAELLIAVLCLMAVPVSPAVAADGILTGLTAEMLTDECSGSITKDLTLPDAYQGHAVSWSSSDAAVISAAGTVTRDRNVNQTVTLRAAAGDETKDFTFTVASQMTQVYAQSNFYEPLYVGKDIRTYRPNWEMRWSSGVVASSVQKETLADGSENYYLSSDLWKDRPYYIFRELHPDGLVSVDMRVKMSASAIDNEMYDFVFGYGETLETVKVRFSFVDDALAEVRLSKANGGGYGFVPAGGLSSLDLLDKWVSLRWVMDLERKTINIYVNGILLNNNIPDCSMGITANELCRIWFDLGLNKSGLTLSLDDFAVSAACDEDSFGAKTLQALLKSEHLTGEAPQAITQNLALSLPAFSDLISENDLSVSFTSSNDGVIRIAGQTGVVTRGEQDEKVTVTAHISNNSSDYVCEKAFDFTVKNENTQVYASDTFYYPDDTGSRVTAVPACGWSVPTPSAGNLDAVMTVRDDNHVMKVFREQANSSDMARCAYRFTSPIQKDLTVTCKMMLATPPESSQIYVCRLFGSYSDGENTTDNVQLAEIQLTYSEGGNSIQALWRQGTSGGREPLGSAPWCNRWFDFKVELDAFTQTYHVYINGVKLNREALPFYEREADGVDRSFCTGISSFAIFPYRTYGGGEIFVDDFSAESSNGNRAAVVVYSGGERIDGLELAAANQPVSASVYLYRGDVQENAGEASVIAAVYQDGRLVTVQKQSAVSTDRISKTVFPEVALPENRANVGLRFYCWDALDTLIPLHTALSVTNLTEGYAEPGHRTDPETGRAYDTIDFNGGNALRSYYTMPLWTGDGQRFYFYNEQYKLFEYTIETGRYQYIDKLYGENLAMVSDQGNLFYISENRNIVKMNPDTYEKTTVGVLPDCYTSVVQLLQVNHAETKLSIEGYSNDLNRSECERIPVMDIATGEWNLDYSFGFDVATYAPDHMNINPVYDNLVMFAHEGSGIDHNGCMDRVWMLDTASGAYYNAFRQKKYTDTIPAETVSHEGWSHDGERIVMAMASGGGIAPGGILTIAKDGTDRRYVNNDYSYLHVASSPANDRFLVADTAYNGNTTNLVLIDCYTGQSHLLATLKQTGKNPGHTHPNFSMDGNKVIFGLYGEDGKTVQIGWMDVSDLVNTPVEGGTYALSDSCEFDSYAGTDFYVQQRGDGFCIPQGNHMNVDVKSHVLEQEQTDISVSVSYVDSGTDSIILEYAEWNSGEVNSLTPKTHSIERSDSGTVKTANFTLYNVNLENMKKMGADFILYGSETDVTVKSVAVSKTAAE